MSVETILYGRHYDVWSMLQQNVDPSHEEVKSRFK